MRSHKDSVSNMYPYPMKWSQRKVQYDQHNADEASSSGFIIKSVVTVNCKRPPFKQPLITAIMLIKGLGDLNTEVRFGLL